MKLITKFLIAILLMIAAIIIFLGLYEKKIMPEEVIIKDIRQQNPTLINKT